MKNNKIIVNGTEISIMHIETDDFISLTDIAKHKDGDRTDYIIQIYYGIEIPLSYPVFGNNCIIRILNPSNSRGLENKPD